MKNINKNKEETTKAKVKQEELNRDNLNQQEMNRQESETANADQVKSKQNEANSGDLTKEDFEALGSKKKNLRIDEGIDEMLDDRKHPVDFTAKDLDIPGEKFDDDQERIGSEDEENNHYSLGSDHNENVDNL